MSVKENDYTCGTCKYIQYFNYHDMEIVSCEISGEKTHEEDEACDDWEEDKDELSEDEKRRIIDDRKAHEIMEEEAIDNQGDIDDDFNERSKGIDRFGGRPMTG